MCLGFKFDFRTCFIPLDNRLFRFLIHIHIKRFKKVYKALENKVFINLKNQAQFKQQFKHQIIIISIINIYNKIVLSYKKIKIFE